MSRGHIRCDIAKDDAPMRAMLSALLIVVSLGGLAGCDDSSSGEKVDRNIDRAMKDLGERLEGVGDEIEEDAAEES
ncbi:hypothetical protein HOP51_11235 [Halomonas sp. MCCC 1A11036]|uniref:Uncharacterized protein n=1 Tax=Billgrantia zhangzhouensis TaxID=2733481 RepID=A0ABS9AG14_9GAMM|nr:hypothetical protein [Halomonas zhangzhouensis]MCE8020675.1 hypothetical protein [Halomonas zhangzhouensis]